jgi:hypothetical protein
MTSLCQACEQRPSLIDERSDDPNEPYRVCEGCHERLLKRALRPLEWFNLAKRHGRSKFLLHADFYDDDGEASQPDEDVERPELFPAPTLSQSETSASTLLDYSATRWHLDEQVIDAWRKLPPENVLACIAERFDHTRNLLIRTIILEVAALLRADARMFVRHAWSVYPDCGYFWQLAAATAACLPEEEGFSMVTGALEAMPEQERRQKFIALSHFRSTKSLDWIERHAAQPTVDAWGHLAAASRLNWPKVNKWLKSGRPLNLIAVDALLGLADPRTSFLQKSRPSLEDPPSEQELRDALQTLMKVDSALRIKQRADGLLMHIPALTRSY